MAEAGTSGCSRAKGLDLLLTEVESLEQQPLAVGP
jgi:hypothetical protein